MSYRNTKCTKITADLVSSNRRFLYFRFSLLSARSGLSWDALSWKNVMSHTSMHQSQFSDILNQNQMTTVGLFAYVFVSVKS